MAENKIGDIGMSIDFRSNLKFIEDKLSEEAFLLVSTEQIRNGLISKLAPGGSSNGARNFTVLCAIAVFMDKENKAFPSQEKLAEITGLSRRTVINAVKELEEVEVNGQKIIARKKVPSGNNSKHFKTIYKFFGQEDTVTEEEFKKMNGRDVLLLFCEYYEETFGTKYMPNFGRDIKTINDKMIDVFTDAQLKEIVRVAVTQYEKRWGNKNYPRPSIGQLGSWLANSALTVSQEEKKEENIIQERIAEADKYSEYDPMAALDNL